MNRKFLLTLLLAGVASFAFAQEEGAIRASGSFVYGTEVEKAGLNLGGEYFFADKISGGINFSIFFVEDNFNYNVWNFDGRYYFLQDKLEVYGLLGLSVATSKFSGTFGGVPFTSKDTETGLNIGAGVLYPVGDKLGINGQIKYATPFDGQMVFQAGVTYRIK